MKTLFNLIGEQPMPNLLPVLYLQPEETVILYTDKTQNVANRLVKLINYNDKINTRATRVRVYAYDIGEIVDKMDHYLQRSGNKSKLVFNITGGTKLMSIGMFQFAVQKNSQVVYLQSEKNKSLLYTLYINDDNRLETSVTELPELINVDLYLRAHLNGYNIQNNYDYFEKGIQYENAVIHALRRNNFEVLQGVKPIGEGDQVEIDAVIRPIGTNNVGIAEIKIGDWKMERPKKGIDQLSTAGSREYLGIYTKKFLITSRRVNAAIKKAARKHGIVVIDTIRFNWNERNINNNYVKNLISKIRKEMT